MEKCKYYSPETNSERLFGGKTTPKPVHYCQLKRHNPRKKAIMSQHFMKLKVGGLAGGVFCPWVKDDKMKKCPYFEELA